MDASSESAKSKKDNKQRVKEHRQRKKIFYEQLEAQVVQLKEENQRLTNEIKRLKEGREEGKDGKDCTGGLEERLEEEERYLYENIAEKMKNNIDDVKFTMIDQSYEKMGNGGSYRIELIKELFRKIVDNVVAPDYKAFFAATNSMSYEKWVHSISETPNEGSAKCFKRFKCTEKSEIDMIISGVKFSKGIIDIFSTYNKDYANYFKNTLLFY